MVEMEEGPMCMTGDEFLKGVLNGSLGKSSGKKVNKNVTYERMIDAVENAGLANGCWNRTGTNWIGDIMVGVGGKTNVSGVTGTIDLLSVYKSGKNKYGYTDKIKQRTDADAIKAQLSDYTVQETIEADGTIHLEVSAIYM